MSVVRRAVAVLLLAAGVAHADLPAKRKPLPPKVAEAARALFEQAEAAEAKGDLDAAIDAYRQAFAIAPHPDVQYNLAAVLYKDGNIRGAAEAYRKYLELAPDARDRGVVESAIAALEATPGRLEIDSKTKESHIFIDGVDRGGVPLTIEVPDGEHRVEAITALSYRSMVHKADWARRHGFFVSPPPRVDGNVILSGHGSLGRAYLKVDGADGNRLGSKVELAAGKRTIEVRAARTCTWKTTVVAPSDASEVVLYVYLDLTTPLVEPARGQPQLCPKGRWKTTPLDL